MLDSGLVKVELSVGDTWYSLIFCIAVMMMELNICIPVNYAEGVYYLGGVRLTALLKIGLILKTFGQPIIKLPL